MNKTVRLDDDGIWLSRELETIEARVFEKKYADIVYPQVLPVDTTTVDNASDTYTYRMVDRVGKFRVIQDRASDLPRVDVFRKETTMKVVSIAASYAYTVQETRAARRQGFGLQEQRVLAYRFEGRRFDCGSRIGLVEATIEFALEHDDLAEPARAYMREALAR